MMLPYLEINSRCVSCDVCKLLCPEEAILHDKTTYIIDRWQCTLCHICVEVCPVDCIKLVE